MINKPRIPLPQSMPKNIHAVCWCENQEKRVSKSLFPTTNPKEKRNLAMRRESKLLKL